MILYKFIQLLVASLFILVTGCKLAVVVVEGGEVQSTASGICQSAVPGSTGTVCIHEVTDTNYSETFTAVPDAGWHFVKWNSGGDFFCQDSTNPTCVVSNLGTTGNAGIEAIVASDQTFYIMPVFTFSGTPITDTIIADGKEWAQPDLFLNLSWGDINAVCPSGICTADGLLNGQVMTGWTWAAVDDLNSLFNSYIGSQELGPGQSAYGEPSSLWAGVFFSEGWRPTSTVAYLTAGLVSELVGDDLNLAGRPFIYDRILTGNDTASTIHAELLTNSEPDIGAWFYRTP